MAHGELATAPETRRDYRFSTISGPIQIDPTLRSIQIGKAKYALHSLYLVFQRSSGPRNRLRINHRQVEVLRCQGSITFRSSQRQRDRLNEHRITTWRNNEKTQSRAESCAKPLLHYSTAITSSSLASHRHVPHTLGAWVDT